ncbi:hypothetical protein [Methylobacterium sp. JK268]
MLEWLRRTLTRQVAGDLRESEERLSQQLYLMERRLAEAEQVLIRHGLQIARIDGRTSIQRQGLSIPRESDQGGGVGTGPKRTDL